MANKNNDIISRKKFIAVSLGVTLCVFMMIMSITYIPVGHTGILLRFGSVTDFSYTEGFHFHLPFIESTVSMSNKVLKADVEADSISRDLQAIMSSISINYHLSQEKTNAMYKNVGKEYEDTLLQPAIQESVKAVMAKYSAEELITNRGVVSTEIRDEICNKITPYGIVIDEFNLTNFNFSEAFDAAIEAKQIAEQDKIKAKTEKERKIIEAEAAAQEKTIAAEAEAEAIRIKAEADANAIEIKAKAEADANRTLNETLNGNIISYKQIEKWDGILPKVTTDNSMGLIVDTE